jgi:hypothetical protein
LRRRLLLTLAALPLQFLLAPHPAQAGESIALVVSIPEQKLYVFDEDGHATNSYRISTSQFGIGDACGSYTTPAGQLEIAAKIGAGVPVGTVFRHCRPTGEVCAVNARGRDPIVTRILHLRGLEKQNCRAFSRGIFIHGTPDERHIGRPVSYGCIRMRSKDVVELFELVQKGTKVEITHERVGSLFGSATRPSANRDPG